MASKYWIKLYHEILDDHKMGMLSDHLYRRTIEMFLLAGDYDREGLLPSLEAMAWRLRTDVDSLEVDLKSLTELKIITQDNDHWIVRKFKERQAPVPPAERMKRMRDRNKQDDYYGTVTSHVTKRNTDKIRIDKDIDNKQKIAVAPKKKSKEQIAFDKIVLELEAYNIVTKPALERLKRCKPMGDGDTLVIIPDTTENYEWLNARMYKILNRRILGVNEYQEIEIRIDSERVDHG